MTIHRQTVVIGGGITGLACAYRLQQLGLTVLLLEASDRLGGVIAATKRNGFLFEGGPQCPRFPRPLRELVRDIGLQSDFVRANPRGKRYILKGGQLWPAPLSPWSLMATSLVGFGDKARFLAEPFGHATPPDSEETLAEFIRRKFGAETLDYLVDPFVSAIFFADPEDMGVESALPLLARWERQSGSVFRGAIKWRKSNGSGASAAKTAPSGNHSQLSLSGRLSEALPPLGSFKQGLVELIAKLAEKIGASVRLSARVESVRPAPGDDDNWSVRLQGGEEIFADRVVIAAPSYAAAGMLKLAEPRLGALLAAIPYSPLAVVSSAYDRSQVRHPLAGSSFVVPRREGLHTISSTWNSSIFPNRAPQGKVLLTNFARPFEHDSFLEMPLEKIAAVVESEVAAVLGISGEPIDREVWIHRSALPHFSIGHAKRIAEIREIARTLPGLHLIGNYFAGRSVGDCVEIAFGAADQIDRELKRSGDLVAQLQPAGPAHGESSRP